MNSFDSLKAAAFCVFVGGTLFFHTIRKHRQSRKIQDTPTSKSATAAVGTAEFEGFAWHAGNKYPTASGMEAVHYSFQIQQEVSKGYGKNKRSEWVTVFAIRQGQSFYLVDPTGLAEVMLHDVDLNLETARTRSWRSIPKPEQDRIKNEIVNLEIPKFPPSDFLFGLFATKTRVVENEILVGSPVYALGNFMPPSAPLPNYKATGLTQFASRVFDAQSRSLRKLTGLLDKDGDGKVSAAESKAGYSLLAKISINKAVQESQVESEFQVHGFIATSDTQKLIVADAHQAQLVERMTNLLWFKFLGGAALITLGLVLAINPAVKLKRKEKEGSPSTSTHAKTRSVAVAANEVPEATRLHFECVKGQAASCARLVEREKIFELSPANLAYYKQQLCKVDLQQCK